MARIPEQFIRDLIAKADIVDVVSSLVDLKKKGQNYLGLCPFHQEKTPSFTVSAPKQFYHCFGCAQHGNAVSFIMETEKCDFVTAVESLASKMGLEVPRTGGDSRDLEREKQMLVLYAKANTHYLAQGTIPEAQAYLSKRGLSPEIIQRYEIGFSPNTWDGLAKVLKVDLAKISELEAQSGLFSQSGNGRAYDRFRGRLMFPIRNRRGEVIAFGGRTLGDEQPKYLNSAESLIFHKRSELYGLYESLQINPAPDTLILVEGYMDVVALAQAGIENAVAALGTAVTEQQLLKMFKVTSRIIFSLDGDAAGQAASWRTLERALPLLQEGRYIQVATMPEGDDPDSFVAAHGKAALLKHLKDAPELTDYLLDTLAGRYEMSKSGGRAEFIAEALKLTNKLPQGAYRAVLKTGIAGLANVAVEQLPEFATKKISGLQRKAVAPSKQSMQQVTNIPGQAALARWATAALLQSPHLVEGLSVALSDLPSTQADTKLLHEVISGLKQRDNLSPAQCIEIWRETEFEAAIVERIAQDLLIPEACLERELDDVLKRLIDMRKQQRVSYLLERSASGEITEQEKVELLERLKRKHQHKS